MGDIFVQILHMGYMAAWAIVFVLLARLLLKRAPKKYAYMLWAIPFLRLVLPFSIESIVSIMPQQATTGSSSQIQLGQLVPQLPFVNQNAYVSGAAEAANNMGITTGFLAGNNLREVWVLIGTVVWLIGMAALVCYSIIAMLQLHRRLIGAVHDKDNLWISDYVESPCVVGIIHPRIYLPSGIAAEELEYMISHEQVHIRRKDYLVKIVIYMIAIVYWFHPLVWLAYFLCVKDMEMSCDEAVLLASDEDIRACYADSLLKLSAGKYTLLGSPTAFSEGNAKSRIRNVLHFKKPAFWAGVAAVAVLIVLAVCILSNPKRTDTDNPGSTEQLATETEQGTDTENGGFGLDSSVDSSFVQDANSQTDNSSDLPEISAPSFDPSMNIGADGIQLDYADERYVIFHGYYGLFVYDMDQFQIMAAVDLEPFGCNFTQGDNYCEVFVAADGSKVYLHPASEQNMYVYDVNMGSMSEQTYDMTGITVFDGLVSNDEFIADGVGVRSDYLVRYTSKGDTYYGYLESYDGTIGAMNYVIDDMVYTIWNTVTYRMSTQQQEGMAPHLTLNTVTKTFAFVSSMLSSYFPMGTYEITGDVLTATTDDGTQTYLFKVIDNNTLRFIQKGSSEVIQYEMEEPKVVDGAEFVAK